MREPFGRTKPWRAALAWAAWCLFLGAWTAALLTPQPVQLADATLPEATVFPAAKLLHVSAYAFLALSGTWLGLRAPFSWPLLVLLSIHALGTEYLQQFVDLRTGSWRDVGLDHLGIALGLGLTVGWRWWRIR
jgi:hypothetical protein